MALSHQRPDLERLVHGSIVYHLAYEMALGLAPPTAQRSRSRFPVPSRRRAGGVGRLSYHYTIHPTIHDTPTLLAISSSAFGITNHLKSTDILFYAHIQIYSSIKLKERGSQRAASNYWSLASTA